MTAAGKIRFSRVDFRCSQCTLGAFAADERVGISGRYSPQAQRLICLAGGSWSFDVASERLEELCGLSVSDNTIRELTQEHGAKMLAWQRESFEAVQEFRQASGDIEFTTDGTSVNTTDGWREMKLALFSKRHPGEPARPEEWESRHLPKPHVRVAFAAIEKSDRFGSRWRPWCQRLGILDPSRITVVADGAKWIWEETRNHLWESEGVLDVFHALEHLSDTAQLLYGEQTAEAERFREQGRALLLSNGFEGLTPLLEQVKRQKPLPEHQAAIEALETYLGPHADHLHYAQRLSVGQSIGSGQIEGACKNLVGRRLKQTGARWRPRRVNRMAGLCAIMYSDNWKTYWNTPLT
jgi:hypothetical protein